MTTPTLATLTTPLTVAECSAAIYAAIEARGASTTAWKPGSVVRTIIAGLAIILAAFSQLQASIAASGFLSLSTGYWLTLVAWHVYGVARIDGTFATGFVTLVNGGGGSFSGSAGDVIVRNPTTLKTYRNTAAYTLGSMGTTTVAIQADEIGTASTSTAGTIIEFVTPLTAVTVSNAAAVVGSDAETDEALRLRCAEKLGSLSPNGPRDAYGYLARSAVRADGTSIGVTRVLAVADGVGGVDVYAADSTGTLTGTVGNLATDLGRVDDAIQTQVVPLAITGRVHAATALPIDVTYELWLRDASGLTDGLVENAVAAALLAYITAEPIGGVVVAPATGKVYVSALESVIGDAVPDMVVKVAVTVPAADVPVAVAQCPMLGTVLVSGIHQLASGVL